MKSWICAASLGGAVMFVASASAQTVTSVAGSPSAAVDQPAPPTDVSELASLFKTLCMKAFPDAAAVKTFIAGQPATPMSPTEVQRYLHTDPGLGWYVKTAVTLYAITLEDPPFHTCAIRRMTPEGAAPGGVGSVAAAVRVYAAFIGGTIVTIAPTNIQSPHGPTVQAFGIGVLDATGKPSDSFGVFLSNYHTQAPAPWAVYATPGVGVEVRLTRQTIGR